MNLRNKSLARRYKQSVCLASALLILGGSVRSVEAQQVQGGGTTELLGAFIRGVDTTSDPSTNGYFIVGGQGAIYGMCVNAQGARTSALLTINSDGFGAFPRAKYSPHIAPSGGFLVVWGEEVGNPSEVHARTVTCSGQMGPERVISGGHTAWLESGAAIGYSPASQRFLVAWKSYPPSRLKVALVDVSATLASAVVDISPGFGRDPGVAWNPNTNQFGVSFSGESGDTNYSAFAVVPASNPAAFARTTFNSFVGGMNSITDLDFNTATGRYLMSWFELSSGSFAKIAEFDAAGNLLTSGVASSRLGSYDALSHAYNPVSGTSLLIGLDRNNDAVLGLELNARGFPFNGENTLSATFLPARYPRVAASSASRTWNLVFSGGRAGQFAGISSLIGTSFASSGGPGGAFGSGGSGTPPPSSGGCPTIQPGAGWTCVNGGWLPPGAAGTPPPSSSGCPTISPGAGWTCVYGGWLPPGAGGGGGTSSCPTMSPGAGWTCVNGGWLPPGTGGGGGGGGTSSCPTIQPGAGWTCVNGGWLPPGAAGAGGGGTSSCPTMSPGAGWTCVNGGWLPPGAGGGGTSSCPTIQPGAGWTCVNGGWLPPGAAGAGGGGTSSCPTISPGANWTCVNGGWLPPGSAGGTSACTTVRPGPNWTCSAASGNWLPPGM